jgi:hypothetical protein
MRGLPEQPEMRGLLEIKDLQEILGLLESLALL